MPTNAEQQKMIDKLREELAEVRETQEVPAPINTEQQAMIEEMRSQIAVLQEKLQPNSLQVDADLRNMIGSGEPRSEPQLRPQ